MTKKINHSRPYLRYIDNLRREISSDNRPSPSWFNPDRIDSFGVKMREPETWPAFVLEFEKLPIHQQQIASCAIEAYRVYLETTGVVISRIIGAKPKARHAAKEAQDSAYEILVVAAAVLAGSIIEDLAASRDGFWGWFQRFYDGLDRRAKFDWADFADLLLKEGLPLYFAQQLADSPAETERLRDLFSEDAWV